MYGCVTSPSVSTVSIPISSRKGFSVLGAGPKFGLVEDRLAAAAKCHEASGAANGYPRARAGKTCGSTPTPPGEATDMNRHPPLRP